MEKLSDRIPSLDGLRTISIVLVVFSHLLHSFGLIDKLFLGNLGVRIFFVISGFLITGLLIKEVEKTKTINLWKFYFRRTLRIFPPFYFYLLILLALTLLGVLEIPLVSFPMAFFYTTNYLDPKSWYLSHSWSLSVEEQFYLIFPSILFYFGLKKSKIFLLILVLISPIIRYSDFYFFGETHWLSMGFHQYMDALGFGCLLALYHTNLHQNLYYQAFIKSKLIVILPIIILSLNLLSERPKLYAVACSLMNLSIAVCIDWCVTNYQSNFGKVLNSSPMIYLGMMSYSIYLWQQPFFIENDSIWTKFPLNFIGMAIMSLISYYLVEKYSLSLRQNVESKLFTESSEAKTQAEPITV